MTHQCDYTRWLLRGCALLAALTVTVTAGDVFAQCARGGAGAGGGGAMMGGAMQGGRGGGGTGGGAASMMSMLQMAQQMQAMRQQQIAARAQQLQALHLQSLNSGILNQQQLSVASSGSTKSPITTQRQRTVKPRLTADENRARLERRRELLAESRARRAAREGSDSNRSIVASSNQATEARRLFDRELYR
jgi:delta 1-pyrroline-5-carboxylate dehydrogenase